MSKIEARVASLHFYPIKSCGGTELRQGEITEKGFMYDRHWMVVEPDGLFLTQREIPKMALIKPMVEDDHLILGGEGEPSLYNVPVNHDGPRREVEVWGNRCEAVDEGDVAAQWLSDYLGIQCRLVHMSNDFVRENKPGYGRLQFADSFPFLIASKESLQELNKRIEENGGTPVPMNRFRPNIVVQGCPPYAEDSWARIQINDIRFDVVKPCIRCPIPQTDQETAEVGKEPTKTLLEFRRISREDVIFAQKAVNIETGVIEIGNEVTVLEGKQPPRLID